MLLPVVLAVLTAINPETISPNQMQIAAGKLSGGVYTLRMEARNGLWYPDGPNGMARPVAAFAEEGQGLQNPGPLVRVPLGTEVRITLRNALEVPMWVYGLGEKRGAEADSFMIAAGASREVIFTASEPGLFYYAGKTTPAPLFARGGPDSQLNGVIVVDPPGPRPADRIFVISWYFDRDSSSVSGLTAGSTMAINGLEWPHTQRIQAMQNETLHWRWVNMVIAPHPLHLHGFYYTIDGKGNGSSFQSIPEDQRTSTVTEVVMAGGTLAMSWKPNRPGNWIFHCHFTSHMTTLDGLNKDRRHPEHGQVVAAKSSHDEHYMAGLVLGVHVTPVGEMKASSEPARPIRLLARSKAKVYGEYAGYGYALGGAPEESDPQAFTSPGPLLVLKKDEPVAVNIINQTYEAAAVHWHGIELESFPDGVPGFSGYNTTLLPAIPSKDSLTVRFTPPRAGTFMYHSHFNENQQIGSGMYGAIVVLDPGETYNPATDKVFLFSDNGPIVHLFKGPFPKPMMNGKENPEPIEMKAGVKHRLRMINIQAEGAVDVTLLDGDKPVEWSIVARDGANLKQAKKRPAKLTFASGQIMDFEVTPAKKGTLTLRFGLTPIPGVELPPPVDVVVNVK